jgi:replicative DNA helicase
MPRKKRPENSDNSLQQRCKDFFEIVDSFVENGPPSIQIDTGSKVLNKLTGGYRHGAVNAIVSHDFNLREAFILNQILKTKFNTNSERIVYFSTTANDNKFIAKLASVVSKIDIARLFMFDDKISADDYDKLANAVESIYNLQIEFLHVKPLTIEKVSEICEQISKKYKIKVIVIDNFHLLTSDFPMLSPFHVREMSSELSNIAVKYNAPLVFGSNPYLDEFTQAIEVADVVVSLDATYTCKERNCTWSSIQKFRPKCNCSNDPLVTILSVELEKNVFGETAKFEMAYSPSELNVRPLLDPWDLTS